MPKHIDIPVPDLTGRRAVITGASDGIGLHIAERLAVASAQVVLPVRNRTKGDAAADRIRSQVPNANVEVRDLDLSSLESVRSFTDALVEDGEPIHLLANNAGIMTPPSRRTSADGFELQFATNHLGHVALTLGLLPLLRAGEARVTTQVSVAANQHAANWDDINWEHDYHGMRSYSSSKIALGLFAMELQRRSAASGWGITSNLAHPGVSPTNLLAAQPGMGRSSDTLGVRIIRLLSRIGVTGTPASAALPAVYAATSPEASGGRMYAPGGFRQLAGPPTEVPVYSRLLDADDGRRIWDLSEQLAALDASD